MGSEMCIRDRRRQLQVRLFGWVDWTDLCRERFFPNVAMEEPAGTAEKISNALALLDGRETPARRRVRVLPALHQHHQGVDPEEDDDRDDDLLVDNSDVDATGGVRQLSDGSLPLCQKSCHHPTN